MDVGFGLEKDPVEAGLHGEAAQCAVLFPVPVVGFDVQRPALVVQGAFAMRVILIVRLSDQ